MAIDSIPARLFQRARELGSEAAYFEKVNGDWQPSSWQDYANQVRQAAKALVALGVEPGHTVCILGFNRPEWVIFDVAAMAIGAVPAGIYTTCSPNEVQYIVSHAESAIVLVENAEQWDKLKAEREKLPQLRHVVTMRGAESIDDDMVLDWASFLANADSVDDSVVDERLSNLTEEQLATFIYTSGTTGPPKAVMLTHHNLAWTASAALDLVKLSSEDCSVSYLPLSHIAEQMFSIHAPISSGSKVYFAESLNALPDNLKEVQPTVFFGVPRIWEKFYAAVNAKLSAATGVKAKLAAFAMRNAAAVADLQNRGRDPGAGLAMKYALGKKLVMCQWSSAGFCGHPGVLLQLGHCGARGLRAIRRHRAYHLQPPWCDPLWHGGAKRSRCGCSDCRGRRGHGEGPQCLQGLLQRRGRNSGGFD